MPYLPNASTPVPLTAIADTMIVFEVTLAVAGTAEDFVTAPVNKKIMKINVFNEGNLTAYIKADADATAVSTHSLPIGKRGSYDQDGLSVNRFSFIGLPGETPTIKGVAWAGTP